MKKINAVSLYNALIWGITILAVTITLHWSGNESVVIAILGGAAAASIILVSNALPKE
jgi:hypothetical protein